MTGQYRERERLMSAVATSDPASAQSRPVFGLDTVTVDLLHRVSGKYNYFAALSGTSDYVYKDK